MHSSSSRAFHFLASSSARSSSKTKVEYSSEPEAPNSTFPSWRSPWRVQAAWLQIAMAQKSKTSLAQENSDAPTS